LFRYQVGAIISNSTTPCGEIHSETSTKSPDQGIAHRNFVVTTGNRPATTTVARAVSLAGELGAPYFPRSNHSASNIFRETGAATLLIVQHDRLVASDDHGGEYFYHPNLATVRGHNVLRGTRDVFLDAADLLPGDSVLDCTVGVGCEATLAALTVGDMGSVTGLESEPVLATITRQGMRTFPLDNPKLRAAMSRINIVNADYCDYLEASAPGSYDVVYFDPFFDERLPGSETNVSPLFTFGNQRPLSIDAVLRARTVARKRVVIKLSRFAPFPSILQPYLIERLSGRKAGAAYYVLSTTTSLPACAKQAK